MPDLPWLDAARHALPWLVAPLVVLWRARGSVTLDDHAPLPADQAPPLTVVVPARDEARNIARCVRAVLASSYPRLALVVVDDHSTDGTAQVARDAARRPDGSVDPRLRVLANPPLPAGWMGKQWACATGAAAGSAAGPDDAGDAVLCFLDADTWQAPDLLPRAVAALRARGAGLLSVVAHQEMGTFWEKVVQPQVLAVIAGRYGSAERVSRSRRAIDKIANGQCLLMTRAAYAAVGGHAAVRAAVAEDLKLAQRTFAAGLPVHLVMGERQLRTRMYTNLAEVVRGWRKNVFAGGREAMPLGRVGQWIFPFLLLLPAWFQLWPLAVLLGGALGMASPARTLGAAVAAVATLLFWAAIYWRAGLRPWWALLHPLGAGAYAAISLQAIARGQRVEWRGRRYVSAIDPA